MQVPDLSSVRILEISQGGPIRRTFPGQVTSFSTWRGGAEQAGDPSSLYALARSLASGEHDLILCQPETRSPWHWHTLSRQIFSKNFAENMRRPLRLYGPQLLRFLRRAPVVVFDNSDPSFIDRDNFFLLDVAMLYFKRELPADEWMVFSKTASSTQPSGRIRLSRTYRSMIEKLRPLPLGLPGDAPGMVPTQPVPKTADVFFAGTSTGLGVRERALAEIRALRDEGYVVDIAEIPMPRRAFYERCASAWLTLSPQGHGWDCYRHYEAPACWSVPLINYPSIRRHAPLVDGEHCLFFDVVPGALAATVRRALEDKPRLAAMAAAARAHVLANHTQDAIRRYVVSESLAAIRSRPHG